MSNLADILQKKLKSFWMRKVLPGVHYSDDYDRLNWFYWMPNPWGMDSDMERLRMQEANRVIAQNLGPVTSILEIGCGEGHQSTELLKLCDVLYGIDVSSKAIKRAQKRKLPKANFVCTDLFSFDVPAEIAKFDLVMASEMLYYVRDIPKVIDRMDQLGRSCYVEYWEGEKARLDKELSGIHSTRATQCATVSFGPRTATVVWWRNA